MVIIVFYLSFYCVISTITLYPMGFAVESNGCCLLTDGHQYRLWKHQGNVFSPEGSLESMPSEMSFRSLTVYWVSPGQSTVKTIPPVDLAVRATLVWDDNRNPQHRRVEHLLFEDAFTATYLCAQFPCEQLQALIRALNLKGWVVENVFPLEALLWASSSGEDAVFLEFSRQVYAVARSASRVECFSCRSREEWAEVYGSWNRKQGLQPMLPCHDFVLKEIRPVIPPATLQYTGLWHHLSVFAFLNRNRCMRQLLFFALVAGSLSAVFLWQSSRLYQNHQQLQKALRQQQTLQQLYRDKTGAQAQLLAELDLWNRVAERFSQTPAFFRALAALRQKYAFTLEQATLSQDGSKSFSLQICDVDNLTPCAREIRQWRFVDSITEDKSENTIHVLFREGHR